ncbi:MAG TPA: translocation/assembly module TamB domain-containing protein [Vicinamibacterales bacterium]|nr:translocation/assembly module TamB domain-containing protein [Vicinamibacterales bacterium]
MRIVRRLLHVLILVLTLVVGAAAAAVIVSQTAWFKNWLRGFIVAQANQYLNGTLSIERLGGDLFFGVELENIGVSMDGSEVVAVQDLGLKYNAFSLISRGLSIDEIRLDKPVVYLRREGDTWQLSRLVKKEETEANRSGPAKPLSIDAIEIADGAVAIDSPVATSGVEVPKKFEHLDAKLSFKYEPVRYSIEITNISFRGTEPAIALNALSGGVSVHDDAVNIEKLAVRTSETSLWIDGAVQNYLTTPNLNLQISSDKLSIPEIAQIVPALAGVKLQPAFEVKLNGPFDQLGIDMNVRSSAGNAIGRIVADVVEPGQSVRGDLTVKHIDLAPILNDPKQKSDITGDAHVDVRADSFQKLDTLHGNVALSSPRVAAAGYAAGPIAAKAQIDGRRLQFSAKADAYGASATAAGKATLPDFADKRAKAQTIPFDVSGQLRHVDLRKMPRDLKIPAAESNVSADYHVSGSVTTGKQTTQQIKGDLKFLPSTMAGAAIAGGSTAGFTIDGKAIGYSADATVQHLDLERIGREFNVAALAGDRYKSTINAHLVANGRGTTPEEMDVTARGSITDTVLMGGTIPRLDFDAALAEDTAHVKADGSFSGFDPAAASGKPQIAGKVGGALNVDATVTNVSAGVTADSVAADAMLMLEPSTVGGLEISRANLDGTYHASTGEIRTLEVVGRDVNVNAKGTLALNDTGQSNLTIHADSPSLATIGQLIDQPLTGVVKLDAVVTGNKQELQAKGNFTGDGFKYGDNGALTASSDYTVTIHDLDAANASVTANTRATFVTLGGQNINELTAQTTYGDKQVGFNLTAKQPQRSLDLNGDVLLHPDHQEVHLKQLAMQTAGQTWQLASGSGATINYAADTVQVESLALVNADQRIAADGTFGQPGDALQVTVTNLDLATVDALLLRPPQLGGRMNATSTLSGTKEAPDVKVEFQVTQGAFRQFKYDSFGGRMAYAGPGLDVDARLQQNPTTYLTAKGYLPKTLFGGTKTADAAGTGGAAVAKGDQIDFHVESTPIDLGVVQGFTTALTNAKGTLQAKLDITGTAYDPQPAGNITISNGAFNVVPTGVGYTNLDGRIDVQPDKVHIDGIKVLDNHQSPLTISGDLAMRERQIGGVSINLTADDFKVLDNKMGNVRIHSAMRLTGELSAPRVEGDLGLTTGRIDLDQIMAQVGESAYATEQTVYQTDAAATPASSPYNALQMDLHVTVPNDFVVKADDLKAPGAPIGLGALLITLGGDVYVSKVPWDQVRLYGTVNTVRGHYDFQGRRFDILRDGTVKFEGLDEIDPTLDLRTQRIIQAVTANVNVTGTVKQPQIALSSTPPLDQADILSLIVFNQPLNSVGEAQQISLAQRAESLAAGAAAGQFARQIASALSLDEFEINLAPEAGGGPEVTVGQQLGQNLYLKVQQGVGDINQTNVILEYELTKWLRLRTNVLQGSSTQANLFQRQQGSGADMLFFFSY